MTMNIEKIILIAKLLIVITYFNSHAAFNMELSDYRAFEKEIKINYETFCREKNLPNQTVTIFAFAEELKGEFLRLKIESLTSAEGKYGTMWDVGQKLYLLLSRGLGVGGISTRQATETERAKYLTLLNGTGQLPKMPYKISLNMQPLEISHLEYVEDIVKTLGESFMAGPEHNPTESVLELNSRLNNHAQALEIAKKFGEFRRAEISEKLRIDIDFDSKSLMAETLKAFPDKLKEKFALFCSNGQSALEKELWLVMIIPSLNKKIQNLVPLEEEGRVRIKGEEDTEFSKLHTVQKVNLQNAKYQESVRKLTEDKERALKEIQKIEQEEFDTIEQQYRDSQSRLASMDVGEKQRITQQHNKAVEAVLKKLEAKQWTPVTIPRDFYLLKVDIDIAQSGHDSDQEKRNQAKAIKIIEKITGKTISFALEEEIWREAKAGIINFANETQRAYQKTGETLYKDEIKAITDFLNEQDRSPDVKRVISAAWLYYGAKLKEDRSGWTSTVRSWILDGLLASKIAYYYVNGSSISMDQYIKSFRGDDSKRKAVLATARVSCSTGAINRILQTIDLEDPANSSGAARAERKQNLIHFLKSNLDKTFKEMGLKELLFATKSTEKTRLNIIWRLLLEADELIKDAKNMGKISAHGDVFAESFNDETQVMQRVVMDVLEELFTEQYKQKEFQTISDSVYRR
jgi:hypothetical protein